ncbi:MAG: hypothetical protein UY13_C0002G0476 [Candidatus Pacebacteria bacterium GW2011_GWB1_47_8]|nr:MAG: hypothetical protein UX28_C0002G0035 [Candidatus Pacebacteria bacterium GW2011_GWA1_46_10]KKU84564.1 MAG: hypothetical protein UY13_C0002G0476 [Candidatus Pacebacteria bacterium GW2011_GWB1_47_8]HCR81654.1 hypothetical protein [Candidatus Paceibacterota bacterium]
MQGHPLEAVKFRYPLPPEQLSQYLKKGIKPPLEIAELITQLFCGPHEQQHIKMLHGGNTNLLLSYKGHESSLASWQIEDEEMKVVALQGAKSRKSWRVSNAVDWPKLFAHESVALAQMPDAGIRRITMPSIKNIKNFYNSAESIRDYETVQTAAIRYRVFIAIAMLGWSEEEHQFVRDLK